MVTESALFQYAGTDNLSVLAVNVFAANRPLPLLYSVEKCRLHSVQGQKMSYTLHSAVYTLSVPFYVGRTPSEGSGDSAALDDVPEWVREDVPGSLQGTGTTSSLNQSFAT